MKPIIKTIQGKQYLFGRLKSTGEYAIWEYKHNKWCLFNSYQSIDEMKKSIDHLVELGNKREARQMVADMCGTSYACAKRDMGL